MSRTTTTTLVAAIAGFIVALLCSALAAWNVLQADPFVRVLMPMSGGVKRLAALTPEGWYISFFGVLNAALYGFVGFLIGVLLQLFRPTIERPLD